MQSERLDKSQINSALQILDYLRIEDSLEQADAIFIFGSRNIEVADKAAEIYHQGWAPVVFCMARGSDDSIQASGVEAEQFKARMMALDVPVSAITIHPLATNTKQEAQEFASFLKENQIQLGTLILVTHPYHARRAHATFQKWLPNLRFINAPANINYDLTPRRVMRIAEEVWRLQEYAAKEDIVEQEIPEEIKEAASVIKSLTF